MGTRGEHGFELFCISFIENFLCLAFALCHFLFSVVSVVLCESLCFFIAVACESTDSLDESACLFVVLLVDTVPTFPTPHTLLSFPLPSSLPLFVIPVPDVFS